MTDDTDDSLLDRAETAELSTSAFIHPQFLIFTPAGGAHAARLSSSPLRSGARHEETRDDRDERLADSRSHR
ncbi:hypothetical protein ACQEVB_09055 [Pseudonocardia sp. CA-107938]|uniref:hypothetical protein n=1 Tax=Pseudonocardia sp. CA-107938 TaxID=3240021 RepID=UPI003D910614